MARATVVRLRLVAQALAGIATSELGPSASHENILHLEKKCHQRNDLSPALRITNKNRNFTNIFKKKRIKIRSQMAKKNKKKKIKMPIKPVMCWADLFENL